MMSSYKSGEAPALFTAAALLASFSTGDTKHTDVISDVTVLNNLTNHKILHFPLSSSDP